MNDSIKRATAAAGAQVFAVNYQWPDTAQPVIQDWLTDTGGITHLKIEDGKGRPLGRNFAVKLWPTLVLLDGGRELARVVRPARASDLAPLRLALQATQGRATR